MQAQSIRQAVTQILAERGQPAPHDDESLFLSGKLDSVAAMEVLLLLEEAHGIDVGDVDFDITSLDTIRQIEAMASGRQAA